MYFVIDKTSKGKKSIASELTLHQAKAMVNTNKNLTIIKKGSKKWNL
jgi:hypothetical protein